MAVVIVARIGGLSQIGEAILQLDAIDMINPVNRPVPGHVKPCKAMRTIQSMLNGKDQVAIALAYMPNPTASRQLAERLLGKEQPCIWIVMHKLSESLGS